MTGVLAHTPHSFDRYLLISVCCREMVADAIRDAMSQTIGGSTYPTAKLDTAAALQLQQKNPSVATLQVLILCRLGSP